ncbi:MAG TPA: helix-turn-helix domain-containing protein [Tepidisphaeraceae bacterium]|nr:helix-turn-helix domain-containing protein [Tepidisphaeraceae bacterium]
MSDGGTRTPIQPTDIVTRARLAALMDVSEKTIDRWVERGEIPAPMRKGRGVYWLGKALLKHFELEQQRALMTA